jgi:hypothetical protein
MKIRYSRDYLRKSSIPNYPFTGYYYQVGQEWSDRDNPFDTYDNTTYYVCNTMIKKFDGELRCRISFSIDPVLYKFPAVVIYVIAIDNLKYKNISDLEERAEEAEKSISGEAKKIYFSQVAAIIELTDLSLKKESGIINIIDMQYIPKCSFSTVNFDNEPYEKSSNQQVVHYQSEKYDKSILYRATNNQFIEFNSGVDKLKDLMASQHPLDLNGHMTIRRSGAIQL